MKFKEFRQEPGKEQAKLEKGTIVCGLGDQKVVLYSANKLLGQPMPNERVTYITTERKN